MRAYDEFREVLKITLTKNQGWGEVGRGALFWPKMNSKSIYTCLKLLLQYFQIMTNQKYFSTTNTATQFSSNDIFYEEEDQSQAGASIKPETKTARELMGDPAYLTPEDDSSLEKKSKEDKRCLNHNFQKHTVTTVKKLMRMKYISEGSEESILAYKIWNIFMVSEIKSKKILVVLFGAINSQDDRDQNLFRTCGFEQILCQDQVVIRKAQQILRKRFIETVTEEIVWENIKNFRSIKQCEEFYVYFTELLRIIREGPLLKFRINDKTSRKIREEIRNKLEE